MSSLKLWPEQQNAYKFAIKRNATALFCEQRVGKTFITLALLRKLAGEVTNRKTENGLGNDFCGILIGLLNNLQSTWVDKLTEFLPWLNITTDWDEFKSLPCPKVFLIHFEAVSTVIPTLVRYKKFNWACVDEAHRIANRSSKMSKAITRLSWVKRKLVLTGTPIEKKPTDLYGIFRFLAPEVFGKNWAVFEEEYLEWQHISLEGIPTGSPEWKEKLLRQRILRNKATFNPRKLKKFNRLVKPFALRVTKKDVGIKETEVEKVIVPIDGHQHRCYHEMRKHGITRLGNGQRIMAELRVTNIMKQRQLASGFVYDEDELVHKVGDAKLKILMKMVKKAQKPVVIFTAFRPDNDRIVKACKKKKYDVIAVHGKVHKKLRPDIWRKFQKAQYDIIVCQIKTGGVGVDLWKANTGFVHSMGHSFIDWDQAKARMDSKEKKKPSKLIVLCAAGTVDIDIFDLVVVKKLSGEAVLSQLRRRKLPMAKEKAKAKTETKTKRTDPDKPKYNGADMAKALGVEGGKMRVHARKAGVEKNGGSYNWNSDKTFQADQKLIQKSIDAAPERKAKKEATKKASSKKGKGKAKK